ncbi:MAG: hypothetical protein CMJ18_10515 [Phycisphaeraceae bacterium]|nr:hypothetical protein [Phycisphaeraceae bacterium]
MSIDYTDGRESEAHLLEIIKAQSDLRSSTAIAVEQYDRWHVHYHLSPERGNLVRHLSFSGLHVLELGAGMGAVSRYLAEHAETLTVVEGTRERFDCLSQRLRDLDNWSGHVANIEDAQLDRKFDVICVIGVLEYAQMYMRPEADFDGDAFDWMLHCAARHLEPDGVFLIAIENALGIKYWAGAPEDHTWRMFDSVAGYDTAPGPKTFSRGALRARLQRAGLAHCREYYPFPDYKLPNCVVTPKMIEHDPRLAAELATGRSYEHHEIPTPRYYPPSLAMFQVADAGLLAEFANSFLFAAARSGRAGALERLCRREEQGEVAWYYNLLRTPETRTRTVFQRTGDGPNDLRIRKYGADEEAFGEREPVPCDGFTVRWRPLPDQPLLSGPKILHTLMRTAYYEKWDRFLEELHDFIGWSLDHWSTDGGALDGLAFDANVLNASIEPDGYGLFDLEWQLAPSMPRSWFIFRNVMSLCDRFDEELLIDNPRFHCPRDLYDTTCRHFESPPDLQADLRRECTFQNLVAPGHRERTPEDLARVMDKRFGERSYPDDPRMIRARQRQIDEMRVIWYATPVRIARRFTEWLDRSPRLTKACRMVLRPFRGRGGKP